MPQETQALPSEMDSDIQMVAEVTRKPSNQDSDISYLESCSSNKAFPAFKIPLSVGTDLAALPSTSNDLNNSSVRKLHFHIHFGERIVQFQIEDNLTVGTCLFFFSLHFDFNLFFEIKNFFFSFRRFKKSNRWTARCSTMSTRSSRMEKLSKE